MDRQDNWVFHKLPDMPSSRYSSGCGLIRAQGGEPAIIMAGSAYGPTLSSSSIFLLERNQWVSGPNLPGGFCYGGALSDGGDNFVMLGGVGCGRGELSDVIWRLDTSAMKFEVMPGSMPQAKNQFGTTFVLDNDSCVDLNVLTSA